MGKKSVLHGARSSILHSKPTHKGGFDRKVDHFQNVHDPTTMTMMTIF